MARKIKKIEEANKRAKEMIRNYNSEKEETSEKIQKCHMLTPWQNLIMNIKIVTNSTIG